MIDVTDDKIYLDGFHVGFLKADVPPSVVDRFKTFLEVGYQNAYQCEDCGAWITSE